MAYFYDMFNVTFNYGIKIIRFFCQIFNKIWINQFVANGFISDRTSAQLRRRDKQMHRLIDT